MEEHSKKFDMILNYYKNFYWDINKVRNAVGKWITEEEYKEITGEDFWYNY